MEATKRDCILVEAAKRFAQFGFKKTSIDEIAQAAGVAKGTVYLACSSKSDLFFQVLLREIRRWNAVFQEKIDPTRPADEILVESAVRDLENVNRFPLVRDFLFGKYYKMLPELSPRLDELRRLSLGPIQEILEIGIRQGIFKKDLDVVEVSKLLLDIQIATILFHTRDAKARESLIPRGRAAFDLILNGISVNRRPVPAIPTI